MAKQTKYKHKGHVDIYEPEPPKDDGDWVWCVIFVIVVMFMISSCS